MREANLPMEYDFRVSYGNEGLRFSAGFMELKMAMRFAKIVYDARIYCYDENSKQEVLLNI